MNVSTKELRIQPGRVLDQVANGEEITVTFRGKVLAKIIPINQVESNLADQETSIFGMCSSNDQNENVDALVRTMRQGRQF